MGYVTSQDGGTAQCVEIARFSPCFVCSILLMVQPSKSGGQLTVVEVAVASPIIYRVSYLTLPETNIAPENRPLEKEILLETTIFRG